MKTCFVNMQELSMRLPITIKSSLAALALTFPIQACVPTGQPVYDTTPIRVELVEIAQGVSTFLDLCFDDAPGYRNVPKWAALHGFKKVSEDGYQSSTSHMGFQIKEHSTHKACRFAFVSGQSRTTFEEIMEKSFRARALDEADLQKLIKSDIERKVFKHSFSKLYFADTLINGQIRGRIFGYVSTAPESGGNLSTYKIELMFMKP